MSRRLDTHLSMNFIPENARYSIAMNRLDNSIAAFTNLIIYFEAVLNHYPADSGISLTAAYLLGDTYKKYGQYRAG